MMYFRIGYCKTPKVHRLTAYIRISPFSKVSSLFGLMFFVPWESPMCFPVIQKAL